MFVFYVCVLWLTGVIRINCNDFHDKARHRFGTFKVSHDGNSTIVNAKILLTLKILITGFLTTGFLHAEDGSS